MLDSDRPKHDYCLLCPLKGASSSLHLCIEMLLDAASINSSLLRIYRILLVGANLQYLEWWGHCAIHFDDDLENSLVTFKALSVVSPELPGSLIMILATYLFLWIDSPPYSECLLTHSVPVLSIPRSDSPKLRSLGPTSPS
jgi:hypothetical protein